MVYFIMKKTTKMRAPHPDIFVRVLAKQNQKRKKNKTVLITVSQHYPVVFA